MEGSNGVRYKGHLTVLQDRSASTDPERAMLTTKHWTVAAGIRPKVNGPGEPNADFMICGPQQHGIKGLVNLFGIESPGLTSCLSIGDHVLGLLDQPRMSNL